MSHFECSSVVRFCATSPLLAPSSKGFTDKKCFKQEMAKYNSQFNSAHRELQNHMPACVIIPDFNDGRNHQIANYYRIVWYQSDQVIPMSKFMTNTYFNIATVHLNKCIISRNNWSVLKKKKEGVLWLVHHVLTLPRCHYWLFAAPLIWAIHNQDRWSAFIWWEHACLANTSSS